MTKIDTKEIRNGSGGCNYTTINMLCDAYDEAQMKILVLNEFVREITFKLPLLKFDTANHAQMANDLVQKTVNSIVADKTFEKDQRISTLEALLREVSEKTTNGQMCICCSHRHGKIYKHDSECPISHIQKELGEG